MLYSNRFISTLTLLFPLFLFASNFESINKSIQTAMIEDLESVKYNISIKYGPAEWKKEHFGWDLENEFKRAKNQILYSNPQSMKEYQKIFKNFLLSTKDYHVHTSIYSTELSYFPFEVKEAEGRYFLKDLARKIIFNPDENYFEPDDTNLELIEKNLARIEVRDEILALDGKPIQQVIEELIDENFCGDRSPTGYALAVKNLFFRRAKYGHITPTGLFEITLTRNGKKVAFTRKFPWFHVSEWVKDPLLNSQLLNSRFKDQMQREAIFPTSKSQFNTMAELHQLIAKDFTVSVAKDLISGSIDSINFAKHASPLVLDENEADKNRDTRIKGFLPPLGEKMWETSNENKLYAYLFKHPSGKDVGYVHLPTFSYELEEINVIMPELIGIIQRFNQDSEALVFDITNNPGGDLLFMYAVISCLTDRPIKVTMHRELIIQEDVYSAAVLYNHLRSFDLEKNADTLSGYPLDANVIEQFKQYASLIMRTWESGQRLTPLLFLLGINEVKPHPQVQYNKPIIVLTNELDFSCGDFFPAILQDNKRALIFGQRTAGAGGHVKSYAHSSRFGIQGYSLTASIAYRPDGTLVENVGVSPDISYKITVKDIHKGYKGYIQALNQEIGNLLDY